jgi:hypothetical protein
VPLPGGLHQASKARGLLENTRPSRARNGRPRRALTAAELGDWVDRLCQTDGEAALAGYRTEAEHLAAALGVSEQGTRLLGPLIGAALATQMADTASGALQARQRGRPYDSERLRLFNRLIEALRAAAPRNRPVRDPSSARYQHLPFYEAYFSNFIEGTEFELGDAIAVVYDAAQLFGRADDSHDLLGTYRVVADLNEMSHLGSDPDEFVQLLRARRGVGHRVRASDLHDVPSLGSPSFRRRQWPDRPAPPTPEQLSIGEIRWRLNGSAPSLIRLCLHPW